MPEEPKKIRAILAEDEGMTILLLRRALTLAGYEVVKAVPDGEQAVLAARELAPDFLVMDINMPRMSGIEAARQITLERPLPIIMLTAYSDQALVEEAIAAGACAYLVKPVVAEQVAPAVRTALARFDVLQETRRENTDLRDALETRKLVERAKGILASRLQLNEADAFRRLQKSARDKSLPLKQVALEIVRADELLTSL
ncbi:ANTAR domain-containing response regulator [Armatimonas rosea]|uniref:Response regulator NasT n=1 Tax=Armatimonas rosea TaxID=685828 RepID=A0A7W9SX39_ARMRO|nr:response regulator [Armatimonas rosea]MBB6053518.1 response regulator NasT [Armatimonas rosea]